MAVTLPLEKMTIEEKIHAMETIWEDLCKSVDGVPSPAWHGKILKERERMDKSGDDDFVDWEQAKKNISNDVS